MPIYPLTLIPIGGNYITPSLLAPHGVAMVLWHILAILQLCSGSIEESTTILTIVSCPVTVLQAVVWLPMKLNRGSPP